MNRKLQSKIYFSKSKFIVQQKKKKNLKKMMWQGRSWETNAEEGEAIVVRKLGMVVLCNTANS